MPEISRKHKLSPHVDWDGRDLFIKLIANPNPIFAIFPKDRKKPCIHIKGGTSKTDRENRKTPEENTRQFSWSDFRSC